MGQIGTETNYHCPNSTNHVLKKCQRTKQQTPKLPRGLIGTKCTAQVNIAGNQCNCLLDTGSQVTTIPMSFYKKNLSEQPIKSLNNLLEVEGANGQSVPYKGYVEITVTFPEEFLEKSIEVPTLALIVPDIKSHHQSVVLIGTNTLDVLFEQYSEVKSSNHQPFPFGYRAVLKTLELRHKQSTDSNLGWVRLTDKVPRVMSAGQTLILKGSVSVHGQHADNWVVM